MVRLPSRLAARQPTDLFNARSLLMIGSFYVVQFVK
jgi:hypothetical protein